MEAVLTVVVPVVAADMAAAGMVGAQDLADALVQVAAVVAEHLCFLRPAEVFLESLE
jgi:hypothetical protein